MLLLAEWRVVGIVEERRELKSPKNETWRGYLVKVVSVGLTVEINVSKDQYEKIGDGLHLDFRGRFEDTNAGLKLQLKAFGPAPAEGKVARD